MEKLRFILTGIIIITLFGGCSNDDDWNNNNGTIDLGDEVMLTLELNVPTASTPITYALSEADENKLEELDILVFRDNGENNAETYLYHMHATDIDNNNGNMDKKFKVRVEKTNGDEQHRIVLLANTRDAIDAVKESFTTSMSKAEILSMIQFNSNIKWNTTSSTDFVPLPMWGETANTQSITSATTGSSIGTIKLLRSVARIDVGLDIDDNDIAQGLGNRFKIEDVKVYNANAKSLAAPLEGNLQENIIKAKFPSLVGEPTTVTPAIHYRHETPDFGFIREIYVGEAKNKPQNGDPQLNDEDVFCIVVGGYYTKDDALEVNTTEKTWYRIDLYERDSEEDPQNTRMDVLRNHRYRVSITDVKGPGYETDEKAFNSKPLNMKVNIFAWDEAEMNDITWDGPYQLVVDKSKLTLYKEGNLNPQKMKIYTNYPEGWSIEIPEAHDWIEVTPGSGVNAESTSIEVEVKASPYPDDDQSESRTGYFIIKSGRMQKVIHVTQLNEAELSIEVTPALLTFGRSGAYSKPITVTTYPTGAKVYFVQLENPNPENSITWKPGTGFPATGVENRGTYRFQPAENNTGRPLTATITVYVVDETTNRQVAKQVVVRQLVTDLVFEATVLPLYPAEGGACNFTVTSDTEWWIGEWSPNEAFVDGKPNINPQVSGTNEPYSFNLTGNNSWEERIISFTPKSNNEDFAGLAFQIKQDYVRPKLEITNPTNLAIDFGSEVSPAAKNIDFTLNSKWKFSLAAGYGNVVDNIKLGNTAITIPGSSNFSNPYDGGEPLSDASKKLIITPKSLPAQSGTPVGGHSFTKILTLSSTDIGTATAITKEISIKRVVPIHFDVKSVFPDNTTPATTISSGSNTATVTVDGNTYFQAEASFSDGTATKVGTRTNADANGWVAGKTASVTIPENKTWQERTVTLNTKHGTWDNSTATVVTSEAIKRATYKQPAMYYITSASSDLSTINAAAETIVKVTLEGNYNATNEMVRAINVSNNAELIKGNLSASSTSKVSTIKIPKNDTWSSREVQIQYRKTPNGTWYDVSNSKKNQDGYAITATATKVETAAKGPSTITITGYQPGIKVRIYDNTNDQSLVTGTVASSTGAAKTVSLLVPANTGSRRTLRLEYSKDGGNTFISVPNQSWLQAEAPYYVSGNYYVSKTEITLDTYTFQQLYDNTSTMSSGDYPCKAIADATGTTGWYVPNTASEAKAIYDLGSQYAYSCFVSGRELPPSGFGYTYTIMTKLKADGTDPSTTDPTNNGLFDRGNVTHKYNSTNTNMRFRCIKKWQ